MNQKKILLETHLHCACLISLVVYLIKIIINRFGLNLIFISLSVELVCRKMNFAVVGSGIVGLTTALELQKTYRDARVSILAHEFLSDTTSSVAAGIFRPGTSFSGPTEEITK